MSDDRDNRMLSDDGPDDALDRLIVDAARDYHRPPSTVPRDAMWEAIVAQRASRRTGAPPAAAAPAAPSLD
ncbi:hypothetical protein, partial [Roseisolibacter sp. H3M3-2]|uniref:hypothetical protein n=1 Tax=Roseisolibacter sp. H3M3-2 TaxID=3031323 RepID=UPI0023DC9C70